MKNLTIIGGSGFLGKSFIDAFNKGLLKKFKINKIIVISRKAKNLKKLKNLKLKNILLYNQDIKKIKKLYSSDYFIYAVNSKNNKNNLIAFNNFIKIIKKQPKDIKILFTSSGAVYGYQKKFTNFVENQKIDESKIDLFEGYKKNYAKTKLKMEKTIKDFSKKNQYKTSIARLFTFIGKRILSNKNYAVSDLVNMGKNLKEIKVKSNKKIFRSYMHSIDLVEWILCILISSNKSTPVYNVGSDEKISIVDLAAIIAKFYKKKLSINKLETNNIDYYVPSVAKAKKILNLRLKINLKKSLKEIFR